VERFAKPEVTFQMAQATALIGSVVVKSKLLLALSKSIMSDVKSSLKDTIVETFIYIEALRSP